jgi:hypothetical protein
MEGNTTSNQDNKCQIQKTSDTTFTLIKNSVTYLLTFKVKTQTIDINVKRLLATSNFEGIFTFDDLKALSKVFNFMENLEEIYQDLLQKLNDENVEFNEDGDNFNLKFEFQFQNKKMEAVLKLNKTTEGDFGKVIEEMGEAILNSTDLIKELQGKIVTLQEKNAEQDEKIVTLQKKNAKQDEKIATLENNIKNLKIYSIRTLEYSKIVKKVDIELIQKWIDEKNPTSIQFKLLYRATQHGKETKDFHSRCDNKGSTITFIKTNKSRVFGGFTTLNWDSTTNNYKTNDPQAFIFSLDTKTKLTCHNQNYVIYCNSSYGPTFGGGHDIWISNNWDSGTYSNCGYSYGKNENITSPYYLTGNTDNSYAFTPVEVEVYQVLKV